MRLTTLTTAIFLAGTIASAAAAPADRETTDRVNYAGSSSETADVSRDWMELATPTPASHGREYITLEARSIPFTELRIDPHEGRLRVRSVRVFFADGSDRLYRVNKTLDADAGESAYVDLGGSRVIDDIVVVTDRQSKGSYTLHGAPDRARVAAR